MPRPTEQHIDLNALQHNFSRVRTLALNSKIIAMVKANAYGHGAETVASTLSDADAFGVACLEEAIALRRVGIKNRIVLMGGFFDATELNQVVDFNCDVVIHHSVQIDMLKNFRSSKAIRAWLKINTGMNRLGFYVDDFDKIYERLSQCQCVQKPINLLTHFANADLPNRAMTNEQIKKFNELTHHLPGEKSLANSAGILAFPDAHADWVRPGIMLYGISPFENQMGRDHDLKPVMSVSSRLMAIQQCQKGDAIGYGGTWICPENMPIGIVAIGYGDGYPRHAKNGTPVLINDAMCSLVGRVSMDMLAVDLRPAKNATIGDRVLLWGPELPIEKVAASADTIAYELFCNIRVVRG